MRVRIDPDRQEIEAGGRTHRFRLDCRAGAAEVTIGEERYRVRALRWREKVTLARFADLGADVTKRELVRLCAGLDEVPDGETADVLWEVAWWMNEPSGVPFDSRALANVTLQLCRAAHWRPADLDARSAIEIEAMWQALGGSAPAAPAEEDDGSTRIVIVPDGEGDVESGSRAAALVSRGASHGGGTTVHEQAEADAVALLPTGVVRPSRARSEATSADIEPSLHEVEPTAGAAALLPLRRAVDSATALQTGVVRAARVRSVPAGDDVKEPRGTRGLHRADFDASPEERSVEGRLEAGAPPGVVDGAAAQLPLRTAVAGATALHTGVVRPSRARSVPADDDVEEPRGTRGLRRADVDRAAAPLPLRTAVAGATALQTGVAQHRSVTPAAGAAAAPLTDWDEFADRLAAAAADMGIEV